MKNQNIGLRLGIAFSSLIVVLIGVGWLGLNRMSKIHADLEESIVIRWSTIELSQEAQRHSTQNSRIAMQIFFLKKRAEIDPLLVRRAENSEKVTSLLKTLEGRAVTSKEKELLTAIKEARTLFVSSYQQGLNLLVDQRNDQAAREKMVNETLPLIAKYNEAWNAFVKSQGEQMDEAVKKSAARYVVARRLALLLIVLAVALATAIAIFLTRSMTGDVARREQAKQDLAKARDDLEVRVEERTVELVTANKELTVEILDRKRVEAEQQALFEIIQGVSTTTNLDELLHLVHKSIGKILYAENCCVALYDKETELFAMEFFVDQSDAEPSPQKLEATRTAYTFRSGNPILMTKEIFNQLVELGEVKSVGTPPAAWLGIPLENLSGIIGVLTVKHYTDADAYSDRDVEFLNSVGGQIAMAIERKRAEEALRESEERYRHLVENGLGLICIHDLEGNLLSVNPAAALALGYTPPEMVGKNLMQFIPPAAQPALPRYLTLVASRPDLQGLMSLISKGGEERIWMYRNSLIQTPGKQPYVLGYAQDVTENKQAEAALSESEAKFKDLFDQAPVAYHELDREGRIVKANLTEQRLLGYSAEELQGRYASDFILEKVAQEAIAAKLTGKVPLKPVERTYIRKDGSLVPVIVHDQLIYDKTGNLCGIRSTLHDITQRKQMEEELKNREAQLVEAQRIAQLGNFQIDLTTGEVGWSEELWRIYGLEPRKAGLSGKEYLEKVHPDDFTAVQGIVRKMMRERVFQPFHHRIIRPDGEVRVININGKFIEDENGELTKVAGIKHDITEQKQMEEELKSARDVAVESARLKSEFLANMSHEIRTPMNGVMGMTSLLLESRLDADQRDFAETIRASADSLLTIINDILDFSKIEAGKLHFEAIDFDLRNSVESSVELLAERARDKKLELASLIYSDVPTGLCGDPGRLRQVLTNLIGNALKFTEHGEVIVRANKESEADDSVVIRFAISDTGIGISEAKQRFLFQAFTQADGSTTRKYGGTGLGLAISKQLVELMGGHIGVTSTEGKGSTFWFTARFGKQAAVSDAQQPSLPGLENLRVLIVDDNATNRKILGHQLGSWKMSHDAANSAVQALRMMRSAAARGAPYDMALLDLMMPGMDGFELARVIKSDPKIADVRLVLLTSYGERGHGETARKAGVAAYLTKPVRQSQLFDCLVSVLEQPAIALEGPTTSRLITRHILKEKEMKTLSNKLILLAEDNIVNQRVAVLQLQKLGYRADAVGNGREALEALGRIAYDLVLMDCQMPEMDGYETTAEIRLREGSTKHTQIVAMTAHVLDGDREKCIAAGMDDYVSKPVNAGELARVLERCLAEVKGDHITDHNLTNAADSPPVDLQHLYEAVGDEPSVLHEILDLYLAQIPEYLEKLRVAICTGNAKEVDLIAHNCAGTSATCGMAALAIPFRELERAGREGDLEHALPILDLARTEFARVSEFLETHLAPVVA